MNLINQITKSVHRKECKGRKGGGGQTKPCDFSQTLSSAVVAHHLTQEYESTSWTVLEVWSIFLISFDSSSLIIILIRFLFFFHVQKDDTEDKDSCHHRKGTGIIWKGWGNEALILGMLQWPDRNLWNNKIYIFHNLLLNKCCT